MFMTRLGFVGTYDMMFTRPFSPSLSSLAMEVGLPVLWEL